MFLITNSIGKIHSIYLVLVFSDLCLYHSCYSYKMYWPKHPVLNENKEFVGIPLNNLNGTAHLDSHWLYRLPYYLPITGGWINGLMSFSWVLELRPDSNSATRVHFFKTMAVTLRTGHKIALSYSVVDQIVNTLIKLTSILTESEPKMNINNTKHKN